MNNIKKQSLSTRIKLFVKEEPRKVAGIIAAINGLLQLALSHIHIQALVLVKVTTNELGAPNYTSGMRSVGIGMFSFLFILFALITIFNVIRATSRPKIIGALTSILATIGFGIVYVLKMMNPDSVQKYSDVMNSFILMIVAFVVYLFVVVFLLLQIRRDIKDDKTKKARL